MRALDDVDAVDLHESELLDERLETLRRRATGRIVEQASRAEEEAPRIAPVASRSGTERAQRQSSGSCAAAARHRCQ